MTAADRAMRHMRHMLSGDLAADGLLAGMVAGLTDGLEATTEAVHGPPGVDSDRAMTDPAVCAFRHLPHAAMVVGGTVPARPVGMTDMQWEAYARAAVLEPFGALRGSPRSLVTLARAYLTGTRRARVVQSVDGDPFLTLLITRPSETPNPAALLAAVNGPDVVVAGGEVQCEQTDLPLLGDGTKTLGAVGASVTLGNAQTSDI